MIDLPTTALPSNIEAERALLGAMILDNRLIDVALERIPSPALAAEAFTYGWEYE